MEMSNKNKEDVEKKLLVAMNSLDTAKMTITFFEGSEQDYNDLVIAKAIIKRVLNRSFDLCARNRK